MDIWAAVRERVKPAPLDGHLLRVVESQEQIATNHLVDSLEKQAALEDMLEQSKPAAPSTKRPLHYLLTTPFRYPPLPYGSRFGAKHEPGLFYGSLTEQTAFAETAYYRFLFYAGMSTTPPSGRLITQHTLFAVRYKTQAGLKLQHPPFSDYAQQLLNPVSYADTQALGNAMRESGIEAFEYVSARDTDRGLNAALFSVNALASNTPGNPRQWICETGSDTVSFYSVADKNGYQYSLDRYLVAGRLPGPAV